MNKNKDKIFEFNDWIFILNYPWSGLVFDNKDESNIVIALEENLLVTFNKKQIFKTKEDLKAAFCKYVDEELE